VATAASTVGDKRFPGSNHTIVEWAIDVLNGLGVKSTPTNIGIMVTWANMESGGYNPNVAGGRNNPLNTTQTGPGWVGGGGSQGNISDFDTYENGVRAQVANLKNPRFGYPAIIAGLKAQDPAATFDAINHSSFGTHFPAGYTGTGAVQPGSTTGSIDFSKSGGGATDGSTQTADLTSFNPLDPLSIIPGWSLATQIPGLGGILQGITNPFQKLEVSLLSRLIYLGEILAGMVFITLGVAIVLVDTGALSKAPVPIPV
jgi:hypothetical protein